MGEQKIELWEVLQGILHPRDMYGKKRPTASLDVHEDHYRRLIYRTLEEGLNLNLDNPNLVGTPKRVARATFGELMFGATQEGLTALTEALEVTFDVDYDEMIVYTGIKCWSMCPHHLLPVEYTWSIGYIPRGKVLGASKFPRAITVLAQRPVLQEQLTLDIHDAFTAALQPHGVMVVGQGGHLCMRTRGIKATESAMQTSRVSGPFKESAAARSEFLSLVRSAT